MRLGAAAAAAAAALATAATVTLRNDLPRLDVDGNVVDAHSGMILPRTVNGTTTYFL